ncbi:hypothetical protein M1293_03760 [Candidatus Parvarchaeota archaeon]|nr:hypothetical protein [Candidatus Parvarchaeota archaeon]
MENAEIGEIYGNQENLIGRTVEINANDLPKMKSRSGYSVRFRITAVSESTATAELEALTLAREQVSRLVRHRVSKIDYVVKIKIGDKDYRFKVVVVINLAKNFYKTAVRKGISDFLNTEIKDQNLKDIFIDSMTGKIQNQLHKKLNKIYPTRVAEIRAITP